MNKAIFFLLFIGLFFSCNSSVKKELEKRNARKEALKEIAELPLIVEGENGEYTEWYPGRKQIKIKGRNDDNGIRVGIWKSYFENGVERSIIGYTNGKKDGIYIVRYPNNLIHYRGEYYNDEPIGTWLFYDEEGNLTDTKEYTEK